MLSPISPGYRIEPATVYISGTQRKAFASDFKARPLRIDEDIEIYLPFEGDEKDGSSNHNLTVSRNVEFIQDYTGTGRFLGESGPCGFTDRFGTSYAGS